MSVGRRRIRRVGFRTFFVAEFARIQVFERLNSCEFSYGWCRAAPLVLFL